jgi:TIR domain
MTAQSSGDGLLYVTSYEEVSTAAIWDACDEFALNAFARAHQANQIDAFVSHAWRDPLFLEYVSSSSLHKGEQDFWEGKCLAVRHASWNLQNRGILPELKGISRTSGLTYWVDLACVHQRDTQLKQRQIQSLEHFIKRSKTLIVMCSPSYFRRLWCVYETVCYLTWHSLDTVEIATYNLGGGWVALFPQILDSVKNLRLADVQCTLAEDREILESKVAGYYVDTEAFERFARLCISVLIFRDKITSSAQYSRYAYDHVARVWLQIIDISGYQDLSRTLDEFDAVGQWAKFASATGRGSPDRRWHGLVGDYMKKYCEPVLDEARRAACRIASSI